MNQLVFIACLSFLNVVRGASLGALTCDALGVCASGTCPPGMDQVAPPIRNAKYSVRTGDGKPTDDPREYEPDSIVDIHVRTHDYDGKFIGILIYAVEVDPNGQWDEKGCPKGQPGCDGTVEVKAGEWVIPPGEPFQCSPICGCSCLTHTSATLKRFHHVLHWKAPAEGTGSVIFRVIIKVGPINGGWFYWPMQTDLVLKEGRKSDSGITWVHGEDGQSCRDACRDENPDFECMPSAMTRGYDDFKTSFACPLPLFSSCGSDEKAVAWTDEEGDCFVPGSSCRATNPQCSATVRHGSRYCACKSALSLAKSHEPQEAVADAGFEYITLLYFGVGGCLLGCLLSIIYQNLFQKQTGEPLLMEDLYVDIAESNAQK